jgi:hypothetical protein
MKFGFVGPSYTAKSNVVADEECINFFAETIETPGAQTQRSYFGTPGLAVFCTFPGAPTRGSIEINGRAFVAASDTLYEVFADGTFIARMAGTLDAFGGPVSIAASNIELLVVAGGRAWAYQLAGNTFTDVTAQLAGGPVKVKYSDGYFIVMFAASNKLQISAILDGTTWPGIQVNAVSVFPENIVSIEVSHRELWVIGAQHAQPYQNTGSSEIFDVIPGALIETGGAATFGVDLVDNTVFWISEDTRGARQAWRANGYTPSRISTHAVETALSSYTADQVSNLVSYSYQDGGHLFWVLYIPGTDCTWVYDVAESLWHKRATWHADTATYTPHLSWNHMYAFGKHLVGDWNSGNLYEMSLNFLDEEAITFVDEDVSVNASGSAWMNVSRPLGQHEIGVLWSNFSMPTLPSDSAIQGMYPVVVASATHDQASGLSIASAPGQGITPSPGGGFILPFSPSGLTFTSTEFYGATMGTDLTALAAQTVLMELVCSLFLDNMMDACDVTAVGIAVLYTSATPVIDPSITPPFAVPPGQGLAWSVPGTVANNGPAGQGVLDITETSVTGGVATYTYTSVFGAVPVAGEIITIAGTTNGGLQTDPTSGQVYGALNGLNRPILAASAGKFTINVGGIDYPAQAESGRAILGGSTGAATGTIASTTVVPVAQTIRNPIRRLRRSPTLVNEMEWVYHSELTVDFATGLGPQPPLLDGDGNPRPPQAMLRWSNNRGSTWSNQHIANCGFAGEYNTRVIWRRLGRSRYRVYEVSVSDPVSWTIVDAYLKTA